MTFVPDSRLEAVVASLQLPDFVSLTIQKFSCRKVLALHKKRDRDKDLTAAAIDGLADATSGMGQRSVSGMAEAGRSSSFDSPNPLDASGFPGSHQGLLMPQLTAVMNALYSADGYDFEGVLKEDSFEHYSDAFAFETEVARCISIDSSVATDLTRFWRVISDSALTEKSDDVTAAALHPALGASPAMGPVRHISEWAELFELQSRDLDPLNSDDAVEASRHFFIYCRKTRVMVVVLYKKVRCDDELSQDVDQ